MILFLLRNKRRLLKLILVILLMRADVGLAGKQTQDIHIHVNAWREPTVDGPMGVNSGKPGDMPSFCVFGNDGSNGKWFSQRVVNCFQETFPWDKTLSQIDPDGHLYKGLGNCIEKAGTKNKCDDLSSGTAQTEDCKTELLKKKMDSTGKSNRSNDPKTKCGRFKTCVPFYIQGSSTTQAIDNSVARRHSPDNIKVVNSYYKSACSKKI